MASKSFDQYTGTIWYDNKMINWQDASVHVMTHGLHYASTVFEGERAYNGKIFELEQHSKRLIASAKLLDYDIPYDLDTIMDATKQVLEINKIKDGYIRPIAWRGSEMMGVSAQKNTIHMAIACWEWPSYFTPEARMAGLKLQIAKWRRPDPMTAPTNSKAAGLYMICTLSKHEAERQGFNDALMLDWRGYVAEATGANIFFLMKDGKIHTPKPDCFLDGITRRTVIKLAQQHGFEVVERHIKPEEMADATEAFLTGTAVEVTPIASIADYKFQPAHCCKTLIDAYDQAVRA
ncbi:MAG: branched-chain amino acid aminotransferase [Alphaproteobacteria bacterium]